MAESAALHCGKRVATLVGGSIVGATAQAFPPLGGTSSKVGRSAYPSLRSKFFGSGQFQVSSGAARTTVAQRGSRAPGVVGVRSSLFFDKFGKLFSSNAADEEQVFSVYEINEGDKLSPAVLLLSPWKDKTDPSDPKKPLPRPNIGDLLPYTNKVYGPSGKDYLGVSAGVCIAMENIAGSPTGVFYQTIYTHYVGKYGQIAAIGQYFGNGDSEMAVSGGTGIFKGARGIVKVHNVKAPVQLLYTYYITGVPKLPSELTKAVVPLS